MTDKYVGYAILAYWGARPEAPPQIGVRFWRMLEALKAIDPAFRDWKFAGTDRFWPMPSGPDDQLTRLIAGCVDRADDGDPTPIYGYRFGAGTRTGSATSLNISVHVGSYAPNRPFYSNTVDLKTKPLNVENAIQIASPIFKAALLAIAESWDATWCSAYPWDIIPLWPDRIAIGRPTFNMAWITYLSPRFAPMVTPPASAIVEYTSRGGILMTATEDRFDVTNAAHIAVAREIEAALAPINALPWPPDE